MKPAGRGLKLGGVEIIEAERGENGKVKNMEEERTELRGGGENLEKLRITGRGSRNPFSGSSSNISDTAEKFIKLSHYSQIVYHFKYIRHNQKFSGHFERPVLGKSPPSTNHSHQQPKIPFIISLLAVSLQSLNFLLLYPVVFLLSSTTVLYFYSHPLHSSTVGTQYQRK